VWPLSQEKHCVPCHATGDVSMCQKPKTESGLLRNQTS
jgi:hypothetical protein